MQVTEIVIDGKRFNVIKTEISQISCVGCYFKLPGKQCPETERGYYICNELADKVNDNLIFTEA